MRVAMATSPGRSDQPNEDFVGAVPDAVVLLDGAGLSGTESTCSHGVAWYTRRLGSALLACLSANDGRELVSVLGDAIDQVARAHRGSCNIADPSSPSATVVILRVSGDTADYLVLADSVLVLDRTGDVPQVLTDDREAIVGRRYRAAMDSVANGTPEHDQARREYVEALRAHRNQPGGFWVAADDPAVASEAVTGSRSVETLTSGVLLSDGASRVADRFRLADWPEVLSIVNDYGPAEVIRRVRQAEASDPRGARWPRGKTSDDATIAYCTHFSDEG
jgi:hypothetical protein